MISFIKSLTAYIGGVTLAVVPLIFSSRFPTFFRFCVFALCPAAAFHSLGFTTEVRAIPLTAPAAATHPKRRSTRTTDLNPY